MIALDFELSVIRSGSMNCLGPDPAVGIQRAWKQPRGRAASLNSGRIAAGSVQPTEQEHIVS